MFYRKSPAADTTADLGPSKSQYRRFVVITGLLLLLAAFTAVSTPVGLPAVPRIAGQSTAQSYRRELETGDKVSLSIKNRNGRVSVIASDEQKQNVTIEVSSAGSLVDSTDVKAVAKGGTVTIEVHDRRDKERIDLLVRLPARSKVTVETQAGSVDIVGNLESAE